MHNHEVCVCACVYMYICVCLRVYAYIYMCWHTTSLYKHRDGEPVQPLLQMMIILVMTNLLYS